MTTATRVPDRQDIPKEQTWNAESVFADAAAWHAMLEEVKEDIPKMGAFAGKLGDSPDTLGDFWELASAIRRKIGRLYSYVGMSTAVDSGNTEAKAMRGQLMGQLGQFGKYIAFAEPELIALGEDHLLGWVRDNERLNTYEKWVTELFRQAQFTKSADVEQVFGMLGEPFGGAYNTFSELVGADFVFKDAVGSDGEVLPITQSSIELAKGSPDREIRRTGWENYHNQYMAFKNTLASNYLTSVNQSTLEMRVRGYDSVLHMKLNPHNLPVEVFHNLINTFKANLPTWHRYWDARRRIMGLDQIHPYDLWAPLTAANPEVPFETAVNWIGEGMKPLGDEYVNIMRQGCLEDRWVDWAVNKGKRGGAFSNGAYDTFPFIMMSYDGRLGGMSTLAHELGHSMHSYLSRKHQPEIYARYSMFAAETASNFNQAMTRAYLFETHDDRDFQLALIQEAMENFHRYFFIMPTLARFEYEVHDRVQQGMPLTADTLIEIMSGLWAEGYGDTMTDTEQSGIVWATFGHLYNSFYTFQYATGISAAHALADQVLKEGEPAAKRYIEFLSAGSVLDPLDALKVAGVDMLTPEPVEKAFSVMARLVDRLESLI